MADKRQPLSYINGLSTRKRRRDATGPKKSDYHDSTPVVLSARVPTDLAAWVRAQAAEEGLSLNAYLRNLLESSRSSI